MHAEVQSTTASNFFSLRGVVIARLCLAFVVTALVLPYCWARVYVMTFLANEPEMIFVMYLVCGLAAAMLLTFGLGRQLLRPSRARRIAIAVGALWLLVNAGIVLFNAGDKISPILVALLFAVSTLWLAWVGWSFFLPLGWTTRLLVLIPLVAAQGLFLAMVRADGMDGNAKIDFSWRWRLPPHATLATAHVSPPERAVDLTKTSATDFPGYLGPARSGVIADPGLEKDWKSHPPTQRWRRQVGAGWSGFAIVGQYGVTQEQRGETECVICYDLASGDEAWIHADEGVFKSSMGGPGPRGTPSVYEGRVYGVGAKGLLNCLAGENGEVIWKANILDDYGGHVIGHGVSGSPLIVDDLVVVSPTGTAEHSLVAYDRTTGVRRWSAGTWQASYSSPMLVELLGTRQILNYTHDGLTSHDLASGKILWSFEWSNDQHVDCSQPIVQAGAPDRVFISTGYGKGCVMVQVANSDGDQWTTQALWNNREMKSKFATPVLHRDSIYGLDNGFLHCIDARSGKAMWKKKGRYGHGQILLVGDLLLIQAETGDVVLVEPDPTELRELARIPSLPSKTWNTPALSGSMLIVRNDLEAACYDLPLVSGSDTSTAR